MKTIILSLMFAFSVFLSAISVSAENYGGDDIVNALPEDVREQLREQNITPGGSEILGFSPQKAIEYILDLLQKEITKPLVMLVTLTGVILLCTLAESLRESSNDNSASKMFGIIGAIAGAGMMCTYIAECVARTSSALTAGGNFLLTFIPIFAGIMALAGQITVSLTFNTIIIIASQIFSHIMMLVLIPLTSCILGVSAAGVVNPDLKIEKIAEIIKKVVTWGLGFMLALFTGLLTLQTFVASAADTAATKTAKFVISNSVPLIGGAVSDALVMVKGSVGLLKATTGTFGIIAGILVILPPLLSTFCYKAALGIGADICEIFNVKELASLLKCGESVVSIILATLIAFVVLTVISIGLMLFLTQGGQ